MKTLTDHLTQYAAYHQDPRNVVTHFVGIPMIVLAVTILLSRPQWQMGALIAATGALTFALNPAAGHIAVASAVAFTAAALVDWSVFVRLPGSWLQRANGSNVAGAAVDSLIFPTLAFGVLMPHIVTLQFIAKVAGGAIWAWLLNRKIQSVA